MKKKKPKEEAMSNEETENSAENGVGVEETFTPADLDVDVSADTPDDGELPDIAVSDVEEEEIDPIEAELMALRAERDELTEHALRARAEFDNYRKRMARESDRIRKTAAEGLMRDMLPIVDNLERALSHVEDRTNSLAMGVEMIVKQFADVLSAKGLEVIPAKGEPFDPNIHEALTHQPSDEYPADTVMEEFQRGYRLGDYVLRPTQVVVSSGPAAAIEAETGTENADATEATASDSPE